MKNTNKTYLEEPSDSKTIFKLTTKDNPFDPFTQEDEWFLWDTFHGYNTNSYIARLTKFDQESTEEEERKDIKRAIDLIMANDFLNIYKVVSKKE